MFGVIIGIIMVGLLTRYLGEEGFGNYTTILAYLFFFSSFADFGLYIITINELNKEGVNRSKFYSAVYSLRFFSALILMIVAIAAVWLLPYPVLVKQGIMIISISIFVGLVDQLSVALYQTELAMIRPALADIISKLVAIIGISVGVYMKADLLTLLWIIVVGHGVLFAINITGVIRRVRLQIRIDWEQWKVIIEKTWPIAVSQIFVLIYFKMDTIFLSLLRPQEIAQLEVGIYGASYKFLEVSIAFIPLFMGLVAPVLSRAWSQHKLPEFRSLYQKTFDAFAVVTIPFVVGGVVLATPIMSMLAPGFTQSDTILRILMIAIGIIFFAHLPTYTINTIGEQRKMLYRYATAAALAVILYIVLIPIYSYYAAAGITVGIELLILILSSRHIAKKTQIKLKWNSFAKAVGASLIMGMVVWMFSSIPVVWLIIIGMLVYGVVMLAIKGVTVEMLQELLARPK